MAMRAGYRKTYAAMYVSKNFWEIFRVDTGCLVKLFEGSKVEVLAELFRMNTR